MTSPGAAAQMEFRALCARLLELERERADARDESRLLGALQEAYAQIAVCRAPNLVIAHMLRAAYQVLGFSRAMFFVAERERGIIARCRVDGGDAVEDCAESADVHPGSALLGALRGDGNAVVGLAGELSAPLVDVRRWYVVAPVAHAEGTSGLLYVDGHRAREPRLWEADLVRALAAISGVSYQNSLQFARTRDLAERDSLTGIFNRRSFQQRLAAAMEHCVATERALAYVLIDVDDFKTINDTFGHAHGDAVLKRLAEVLERGARAQDVVGRFAGDEFVVLFTGVDRTFGEKLVERLSLTLRENELRCSIGAAFYPDDESDAQSLLAAADRALYATKRAGKNGFSFANA